jgi:hypothetical protein
MPFKSRAQAAYLRANNYAVYKKFAADTKREDVKGLPLHVKKKKKK